jgi:hypothetical protein
MYRSSGKMSGIETSQDCVIYLIEKTKVDHIMPLLIKIRSSPKSRLFLALSLLQRNLMQIKVPFIWMIIIPKV